MRPDGVAEGFIQSCLENFQGWKQCSLSESHNPKPLIPAPSQLLDHIHLHLSTRDVLLLGGLHSWKQPTLHPSPSFPLTQLFQPQMHQGSQDLLCLLCGLPAPCYLKEQLPTSPSPLPPGLKSFPAPCFALPGVSSECCLGKHFLIHDLSQQQQFLKLSSLFSSLYLLASTIRPGRSCNSRQSTAFKGEMCGPRASLCTAELLSWWSWRAQTVPEESEFVSMLKFALTSLHHTGKFFRAFQ